jgi:TPP-dependent pyruvate/acetoin dehydrogenase alpha subunit
MSTEQADAPGDRVLKPEDLELAKSIFRWMVLSRALENRLRSMYQQSRLRGRLISGRGQEAIPVGAAMTLSEGDVVAPVHRDLGAHLVRGTLALDIVRHYLGRASGPSRGRDGDLHMGEWERGVFPMVSHLPDSWPIAVGIGLAFKLRREQGVVLAFCGDGATSAGGWHEALNFASVMQTPTIFVIENNQYAYSTPTHRQFRVAHLSDRSASYGLPGYSVDGNDALAVHTVCRAAVSQARSGGGPSLIEAHTFRIDGHAIHDDASYVPPELRTQWKARDPIEHLGERLRANDVPASELTEISEAAEQEVRQAVEQAEAEELPDPSSLEMGVYAPSPPAPARG